MKLRPYKDGDEVRVDAAYEALKKALRLLAKAGVVRTLDRVRSALRSAQGAQRHVHRIAEHAEQALWGEVKNSAVGKRTKAEMEEAIKCPKCGELPMGIVARSMGVSYFAIDDDGAPQWTGDTREEDDGFQPVFDEETDRVLLFCRDCGKEYPAPKGFEI